VPGRRRCLAPVACVLAVVVLAGCGDDDADSAADCHPPVEERLDPNSAQHLLPGAAEPEYLSDPPTSGAHIVGNVPRGTLGTPLPRPAQVALLEQGVVLIQHAGLQGAAVAELEALADDNVTVAPGVVPAVVGVVATAWRFKLQCDDIDLDALRMFIDTHAGVGFGGAGHTTTTGAP
jgi:hypothetical protein